MLAPPGLLGIHINMPGTCQPRSQRRSRPATRARRPLADEKHAYEQLDFFNRPGLRPSQMANSAADAYRIADSPVGLAAWMLDHDAEQPGLITRVFDGATGGLTRDDVLDNITLYWLTNTTISSAGIYWENQARLLRRRRTSRIPAAVSVFPGRDLRAPRSWTERAYPKLIHYNSSTEGGHFAAWEQPQLFSQEVRAAFKSLRA